MDRYALIYLSMDYFLPKVSEKVAAIMVYFDFFNMNFVQHSSSVIMQLQGGPQYTPRSLQGYEESELVGRQPVCSFMFCCRF